MVAPLVERAPCVLRFKFFPQQPTRFQSGALCCMPSPLSQPLSCLSQVSNKGIKSPSPPTKSSMKQKPKEIPNEDTINFLINNKNSRNTDQHLVVFRFIKKPSGLFNTL